MLPLPTKFFVTSGKAVSKVSDLNAFDEALQNAGLAEQNIVSVSSVLPVGIRAVRRRDLPMGAITHCVLAQQRGGEGETISAGIAYGFRDDEFAAYVAEGQMHRTKNSLREVMEWKMGEMAKLRGIKFRRIDYRIEDLSIPMDYYGAFFFFQAEDGIRDLTVTGVQTCALPIFRGRVGARRGLRECPRPG